MRHPEQTVAMALARFRETRRVRILLELLHLGRRTKRGQQSCPDKAPSIEKTTPSQSLSDQPRLAQIFGPKVPDLHLTLWDILSSSATKHPNRQAVVSLWQQQQQQQQVVSQAQQHSQNSAQGTSLPDLPPACLRWTYHDLAVRVGSLAVSLEALGCGPGMQLAAVLWNSAEWALFFWAAAKVGMIFVPVDPRVTGDVRAVLSCLEPKVVVVQDTQGVADSTQWSGTLEDGSVLRIQCAGRPVEDWAQLSELLVPNDDSDAGAGSGRLHAVMRGPHTAALIVFTSGTIGEAKGCLHTNSNLVSQTCEFDPNEDQGVTDRWLVHTPVSHIFAVNNALRAWRTGDAVVFASRTFDVDSTVAALVEERCTIMSATPTLAKTLTAHPRIASSNELGLSLVTMAGTDIGRNDIELCRSGLGAQNAIQAYGMSEGAPLISWSRQDVKLKDGYHPGTGRVLPGACVRICRPDSREILDVDEVGELHVSGSSVISSYWGNSDSQAVYDDDDGRWLVTGDRASIDDEGIVYILGRYKDLIIRGGENISPKGIELALSTISGVEAHVIGIPDKTAGQVPVGVVIMPESLSKSLISQTAAALGPQYALAGVYTLEDLGIATIPKTSLGKVKKEQLKNIIVALRTEPKVSRGHSAATPADQLLFELGALWEDLTGTRPPIHQSISHFADSITLLRYCDLVWKRLQKRVHLQDLVRYDTLEKQVEFIMAMGKQDKLIKRHFKDQVTNAVAMIDNHAQSSQLQTLPNDFRASVTECVGSVQVTIDCSPTNMDEAAATKCLTGLGLSESSLESIIPIRQSLHRMIKGQRPQSYHLRVVFRVKNATTWQTRHALEAGLVHQPMLRTFLCHSNAGALVHGVVAPSTELFAQLIRQASVDTGRDAKKLYEDDSKEAHSSSFMFRADIIHVQNDDGTILSLTYNHSVVDAFTLLQWHQGLDRLLHEPHAAIPHGVAYKQFADMFEEYQDSIESLNNVAFHAKRLRGVSRLQSALWPVQRASGWMISTGQGSEHNEVRENARESLWCGQWEACAEEFRYPRLGRVVSVPQLKTLRERHGIQPSLFAKCAISLFNILRTGSTHAVFTTWQDGRSWPFMPAWVQEALPAAMNIDGPTAQWALEMTEIDQSETVQDLFSRFVSEQEQLIRHQHAPWQQILDELREEGPVAVDASMRQSFVWDVSIGIAMSPGYRDDMQELEPLARYDWPDCGLFWNAFMIDSDNLYFIASWDTAQMNVTEMEGHCDGLAEVMRKLAREENWDRTVGNVFGVCEDQVFTVT